MLHGAHAVRHRLAVDRSADNASLGQWREVYGRMLLRLDLVPNLRPVFRFHADMLAWPGFACSDVTTSGLRATRRSEFINDGSDDMGLVAVVTGTAVVNHCGRQVDLEAGEAVFLRSSEPGEVWFPSETRYINLAIPASSFKPLVPELDAAGMATVPAHSVPLRLALRYASLVLDEEGDLVAAGTHHVVASHFRDLAVAMMGGMDADVRGARGLRAVRLRAIKAYVASNLASPDLSVRAVAARQGITPRYVARLFESEGTSFSKFVLNKRLECARQALTDSRYAHLSISSIAGDVGFGDISHFNRAFRRRYGATPSEVRAEA